MPSLVDCIQEALPKTAGVYLDYFSSDFDANFVVELPEISLLLMYRQLETGRWLMCKHNPLMFETTPLPTLKYQDRLRFWLKTCVKNAIEAQVKAIRQENRERELYIISSTYPVVDFFGGIYIMYPERDDDVVEISKVLKISELEPFLQQLEVKSNV